MASLASLPSAVHLHPMLVHFPIALWVAATVAWALGLLRGDVSAWKTGLWLHTAAALGAVASVGSGYLATSILGHGAPGHSEVHVHRNIMLGAAVLSAGLCAVAWWRSRTDAQWKAGLLAASVAQLLLMTWGADKGGKLVYQMGVGVEIQQHTAKPTHHP